MFTRFKNISIRRKLNILVGIMAAIIIAELLIFTFIVHTLSAARALVGGEGSWLKAEKGAGFSLRKYSLTRDESEYQKYLDELKVLHGDRNAKIALGMPKPDLNMARAGFIEGGIHPDDIDEMINLLTRFKHNKYICSAITYWVRGDSLVYVMENSGTKLHAEILSGKVSDAEIKQTSDEIYQLSTQLSVLENDFSGTLGEGSRWVEHYLLRMLFIIAFTIGFSGLLITFFVTKRMNKSINEIVQVAGKVSTGDFTARAKVFGKDEIGLLARSFNKMVRDVGEKRAIEAQLLLEKQNVEKAELSKKVSDEFLATMSHEIRTPMNAIVGFTDILLEMSLPSDQSLYVEAIKTSGANLLVIINDILDFSKLSAGKMLVEEKEFSLSHILVNCVQLMLPKAKDKGIRIYTNIVGSIPDRLIGDPTKLSQVLLNLLSNAVKFTDKGEISIHVKRVENSGEDMELEFCVKDTGIGIPNDKLSYIFDEFTQANTDTARLFGGTGLGLAIVKKLAELQGGKVFVESIAGVGSSFYFQIKFRKADRISFSDGDGGDYNGKETAIKGMKVLVVEDNRLNQLLAKKILGDWACITETAENGLIAIEKVRNNNYDLIIMDIQMPEMDGYEATTYIRKNLPAPKCLVPIIAMSAHVLPSAQGNCSEVGMNDFIAKPFNKKVLYSKVLAILNNTTKKEYASVGV